MPYFNDKLLALRTPGEGYSDVLPIERNIAATHCLLWKIAHPMSDADQKIVRRVARLPRRLGSDTQEARSLEIKPW